MDLSGFVFKSRYVKLQKKYIRYTLAVWKVRFVWKENWYDIGIKVNLEKYTHLTAIVNVEFIEPSSWINV